VLTDWQTYSNAMSKAMPVRADLRDRIPEHYERVGRLTHTMITNIDPPAHTIQRRAAQRTFTRRRIRTLETRIASIANAAIDDIVDEGSCDLMQDYAQKVTLRVIATLLDIPDELLPSLNAWIQDVFLLQATVELSAEDVTMPDDELVGRYERLYSAYCTFSAFAEERVANPGDDLASAMLTLTDKDGHRAISNDQALGYMIALTAAGTDTTANLIVNMVRYFTQFPEQLQRVLDQPELWENAVVEALRRSAIAHQKYRISKIDSDVLGLAIPAGARIAVSVAAANSDPSMFDEPLGFDVTRANASEHLGLGRGIHYCLGAPVVMPEARIVVQTLYSRLPGLMADLDQELSFMPVLEARSILSQKAVWNT
jgi:cytochrome P450